MFFICVPFIFKCLLDRKRENGKIVNECRFKIKFEQIDGNWFENWFARQINKLRHKSNIVLSNWCFI